MKMNWVLLPFSVWFGGCITETSITKDELMPDDSKVIFCLRDSSYITSFSNHHSREEGDYRVDGTIVKKGGFPMEFNGLVQDSEIERYGIDKFNVVGTVVGIGVTAGLILLFIPPHTRWF